MNIVQLQDQLKNFSQDQLVREMQTPSGSAPQFLVLGEIMRRQKMQQDFTAQKAKDDQGTVAQEAVAAAGVPQGGIADMARAMAPSTDVTQNTGVQMMYAGGPVKKMAKGDKVKTDPAVIAMANRAGMSIDEYLDALGEEEAARVVSGAEQRAARNRMMAMEPTGDSITMPTQADLDRRFQEQQFAFGASRPLVAPAGETMPTVPSVPARIIGGPPTAAVAPGLPALAADAAPNVSPAPLPATGPYSRVPSALELAEEERVRTAMGIPGGEGFDERAYMAPSAPATPFLRLPPAPDRSGLSGIAERDFGGDSLARIPELLSTEIQIGPDGTITAVAPEKPRPSRADRDQQGAAAVPTEAEVAEAEKVAEEEQAVADAADAAAAQTAPQGGGAGGAGGGGAGGAGGVSSYEQALMDALASREKAANQDKWLALAQVGLNLMASKNPTFGGALGEAGLAGVEAARTARDTYDKEKLEILGAIEQSRAARAKAASSGSGGGGGLKPLSASGIMTQQKYMLDLAESRLATMTGGQDPSTFAAMLREAAQGGDTMAARQLVALDNAKKQYDSAYNNYMSAASQLGALTMTESGGDDGVPDLSD
jgi:hypothetical protein